MKKTIKKTCFFLFSLTLTTTINAQDIDNDGVTDATDNCPYIYNPTQEDIDGDQIGDACDCEPIFGNPIGQTLPAILIIASPSTAVIFGTTVNFSSVINSGGSSPSYQWKKNGLNVGTNSASYSDNALNQGDIIKCEMTSDVSCPAGNIGISNEFVAQLTSLGINVLSEETSSITIYPNPSKGNFRVASTSPIEGIELFDLSGKRQELQTFQSGQFSLINLENGIYFLKINIEGLEVLKKVVKE